MGVRILIADNHELVRSAMSQLIHDAGWEVCGSVSDGKAAIETALALQPDLVILDYRMPDRDGLSVGRDIRVLLPSVPILLCTMFASPDLEREAKKSGFQGVVQKSDGAALIAVIRSVLGSNPTINS
jgi:DNA-binding NarL/FixJ family response regulator